MLVVIVVVVAVGPVVDRYPTGDMYFVGDVPYTCFVLEDGDGMFFFNDRLPDNPGLIKLMCFGVVSGEAYLLGPVVI